MRYTTGNPIGDKEQGEHRNRTVPSYFPQYDFEINNQEYSFRAENSKRTVSPLYYKSGRNSLLWEWPNRNEGGSPAKLTILLGQSLTITGKQLQKGGIKFWMYRAKEAPASTQMNIVFYGATSTNEKTSPTTVNLNFKGWRGVWIGYEEFGSAISTLTAITKVEFTIITKEADQLYLDLVRFVTSMKKQSRDTVVRKVGQSSRSSDPPFHDDKDFWQQSLRWHDKGVARSTTSITDVETKINEIHSIENSLENWYANVRETLKTETKVDDFVIDMAMDPSGGIDFPALKHKRWVSLQMDIKVAHIYYNQINFQGNRPPLFSKVSEFGEDGVMGDPNGFHHKTFYGSAYVPHALHNAALVQYLLDGTSFALDQTSKNNLREALGVMRIAAVKYSTPNSIGGRFPGYDLAILAEHFPAYAYISYVKGKVSEGVDRPDMFLRLFNHTQPSVKAYLEDGRIKSGIYYWNTIGSLDVLKNVTTLRCVKQCQAETSPVGHWSKNFAALSIHRRKDWSVVAKGFNRYTWDYESSPKENIFGTFASHGSLQISNSESSLKTYNVNEGWDWTRVPGATTIKAELVNIVTGKARNYNPGNFAGGVSFKGSVGSEPRNGAFGMVFKKPPYSMKNKASPLNTMEFEFKKSYFFYNDLIVCLGSDIKFKNVDIENYYAQTTLFQDNLVDPFKSSRITIDSQTHDLRLLLAKQRRWRATQLVKLVDTNGNIYQVKNAGTYGLNVEISNQDSTQTDGCEKTKARYATAWFEHRNRQSTCTVDLPIKPPNYIRKKNIKKTKRINKTKKKKTRRIKAIKKIKDKKKPKKNVKVKKVKSVNKKQKKKIKQEDVTVKRKGVENELFVKGINVDTRGKGDDDMEIIDDADDVTYLDGKGKNDAVYNPDHDEVADVKSIDDKAGGFRDLKRHDKDNDVNDDADDKKYYDEEPGMDGLGTELEYDEGSTPDPDANLVDKNRITITVNERPIEENTDKSTNMNATISENQEMIEEEEDTNKRIEFNTNEENMDLSKTPKNKNTQTNMEIDKEEHDTQKKNDENHPTEPIPLADMAMAKTPNHTNTQTNMEIDKEEHDTQKKNDEQHPTEPIPLADMAMAKTPNHSNTQTNMEIDKEEHDTQKKNDEQHPTEPIPLADMAMAKTPNHSNTQTNMEIDKEEHDTQKKNDEQHPTEPIPLADMDMAEIANLTTDEQPSILISKYSNESIQSMETEENERSKSIKSNNKKKSKNIGEETESKKTLNNVSDRSPQTNTDKDSKHDSDVDTAKKNVMKKQNTEKNTEKDLKSKSDLEKVEETIFFNDEEAELTEENMSTTTNKHQQTNSYKTNTDRYPEKETKNKLKIKTNTNTEKDVKSKSIRDKVKQTKVYEGKATETNGNMVKNTKQQISTHGDKPINNDTDKGTNKKTKTNSKSNLKSKKAKMIYTKLENVMKNIKAKSDHDEELQEVKIHEIEEDKIDENINNVWEAHQKTNLYTNIDHENDYSNFESDGAATGTSSYEYAILIKGGSPTLLSKYTVIGASGKFHAVQFSNLPDLTNRAAKVYAYSIFETLEATEFISVGPVKSTSAPCMMMAELGPAKLYLAVSNPALTFQDDPTVKDKDRCTRKGRKDIDDKFSPTYSDESSTIQVEQVLYGKNDIGDNPTHPAGVGDHCYIPSYCWLVS
ncbi:hypothetical protein QZH41_000618 [Actinostola sp. cb2023]|nr:hypothetical protein QZH41_000618 [Actinostola sp. cb2023]